MDSNIEGQEVKDVHKNKKYNLLESNILQFLFESL